MPQAFHPNDINAEHAPALTASDPIFKPVAERRQLSIMFCDLVGSTAISARLDPEDLSVVIREYQARVGKTIERFGGFVARYVGDGVLIYFGWPAANEANAAQAVRAALALIDAFDRTSVSTESLQVRIGIATGLVVVGEPIGTGEARQQTAIGETPNLAARLQSLAEPNSVVIDGATRRQIGDLFQCQDLGLIALKGLAKPVPAWQVTRQGSVGSHSEALHVATTRLPIIGRDDEIDLLLRCWHQTKDGRGRVVLLSGESGIGKSRLAADLMERLVGEPHSRLFYFCSSEHQASPLFPVIAQFERAADFARRDPPGVKLRKIKSLLAEASVQPEDIALIAELMCLVDCGLTLPAPDRRERQLDALVGQVSALAARQRVVMLFEDAHWIDPTSLELLSRIVLRIRGLPVLLVISSRPGFHPSWASLPHVVTLELGGLRRREAVALATRTAGATALSGAAIEQIIEHTEGVPLFIEELTRAVVEADWHDTMLKKSAPGLALPPSAVPAALYAPLAARLDRLASAREVAQVAAVIGREFSFDLLAAVITPANGSLEDALIRLADAGLISPQGAIPRSRYAFRHALIRDVAYSTLLRDRRRQLHAQVAEALEQVPEQVGSVPELLAQHYTLAGLTEPAVRHLLAAGQRALRASAYREAALHLRKGIELLESLPEGALRKRLQAELKATLALVRDSSKGYGHAFQSAFAGWRNPRSPFEGHW
jgi:class 3 adenylate cyclase